jgi:flagellar biosynthetic protein FliP
MRGAPGNDEELRRDSKRKVSVKLLAAGGIVALLAMACAAPSFAQSGGAPAAFPTLSIGVQDTTEPAKVALTLQILGILTILSIAPAILILTTSFTRIAVVLSFLRTALGTQQLPPNQVILGLSLFLTFFVMKPTWNEIHDTALAPYMAGDLPAPAAFEKGVQPLKHFMVRNTRDTDIDLFLEIRQDTTPEDPERLGMDVLVPAFVISELRTAFQMGFVLYIPFLVIDMVVASVLMSMGMLMLPPVLISLPFKILLFVLVDGWHLVIRSLASSFQV